jgi:hypothetical protein
MSHYHIEISIDKEDVKVIRKEFNQYMDDCGGLAITVKPDNEVEISPELAQAIRNMFIQLITTLAAGKFEGLN